MRALLVAMIVLLAGCGGHRSAMPPEGATVFFGDSIFGTWDLQQYFPDPHFVNGGIFGYRTDELLKVLPQVISGQQVCHGVPPNPLGIPVTLSCVSLAVPPKRIIIYAGWNNLFQGRRNLIEVDDDLQSMIVLCRNAGVEVIVATLYHYDPAHPPSWDPTFDPEPYLINLQTINPLIKQLGISYSVKVVDFEAQFSGQRNWTLDGTHPNVSGFTAMQNVVDQALIPQ